MADLDRTVASLSGDVEFTGLPWRTVTADSASSLIELLIPDNERIRLPVKAAANELKESEEIVAAAAATSGKRGLVVLTGERILFVWKAGLIAQRRSIPLESITSTEGMEGRFAVFAQENLVFHDIVPADVGPAVVGYLEENAPNIGEPGVDHSALRLLSQKVRDAALQHISPNESVQICLVGAGGQALVALENRLLIVKAGFMAGQTFGAKVNTFDYPQIIGIEVSAGFQTAVLQVQTPNFPNVLPGSYWTKNNEQDPWKLPNCLPIGNKRAVQEWAPYLEQLRGLIAQAKQPAPPAAPARAESAAGDLAESLERLKALHESGALSDAEYAQAKAKLLD